MGKMINNVEKYYAGIGSRETPKDVLAFMTQIAKMLYSEGYTLRSGGADGADSAFEQGAGNNKQIFLPWKNFNKNASPYFYISDEAIQMASKFHPFYHNLKQGGQKLHARNCYQILGEDLKTPSEFVICWTPNGLETGGTSQAIRIAKAYKIKIYNLGKEEDLKHWTEKVKEFVNFKKWEE